MSVPTPAEIQSAAAILRSGGLVAFPTETVYGLGADADNEEAVRRIFAAKGRPADHPVIVHLASIAAVPLWAEQFPESAQRLAKRFWPGPLTLILPRGPRAKDVVTGGLASVGLRVPRHPVAQTLLRAFSGAIAAPSANRFGRVSPTTADHVRSEFGNSLDLILDGGPSEVGLESTIVDFTGSAPAILRPGAVTQEQVEAVCGPLSAPETSPTPCAGRLESHYAPRAAVELVSPADLAARAAQLVHSGKSVAVLGTPKANLPAGVTYLSWGNDAQAQAQTLYSALRQVDDLGCDVVLVSPPDENGLGAALLDRLKKASGPRS